MVALIKVFEVICAHFISPFGLFIQIVLNDDFLGLFAGGGSFPSYQVRHEFGDEIFLVFLDLLDSMMGLHMALDEFIGFKSISKLC